jgi:hypothetical protein
MNKRQHVQISGIQRNSVQRIKKILKIIQLVSFYVFTGLEFRYDPSYEWIKNAENVSLIGSIV